MKICTNCKKTGIFHKDKNNSDGLNRWCVECKRNYRFKTGEEIETYLTQAWNRMKRYKIRTITKKELFLEWDKHCEQNRKKGKDEKSCRYTGELMTTVQGKKNQQSNISIDRIINSRNYEVGNIAFCTTGFNRMKGEINPFIIKCYLTVLKEEGLNYEKDKI